MKTRLGRGKYTFKDLDSNRLVTVKASDASNAVKNLNKKLGKKVNYTFRGYSKS